ncbi:putative GTP cyclohydrolase 1 type 2 [Fopius arisanus]|uniref:NIF3-like protein 1 n=1 Tax=Fopius arisanus TaxID=64838 RepID=A0A0C9RIL3_9HYME|nr:PREDICTED: putative GTP cyclohydrolase 1 type 2 [Fopius arisanus]
MLYRLIRPPNLLIHWSLIRMSTKMNPGIPLTRVVEAMNNFADQSLAESWDNVGLLVEPTECKNISRILLTNDLTERVMKEAIDLRTDLIISYHPPIFAPLKSVTTRTWKERIVAKCLEHKIALYSPHTSFDSIRGGVNDWLAGAFETLTCEPIQPALDNSRNGMGRICTLKTPITDQEAVNLVKRQTNLNFVRLARVHNPDKMIKTVALCAGSGASVLKNVQADLFVTGEMLHHDVLDAVHRDTAVILTNHSDSERGFLPEFSGILGKSLGDGVVINVSKTDRDPLMTV